MAPEAGQPEKPAALNRGPRLRPGKRTAGPCEGRLPAGPCRRPSPLRRKAGRKATAGRPQWKRGKGGDAGAKDGGRPPGKGGPLQGFPSLGSRPRDVPQTSSRSRFRHGNDSAGERFFHVQVRFSPQRALVTITFEGEAIQVEEGTTVAAAVLDRAGGETRTTARKHDGRGPYCHMGVCYECLMEIDGVPNQQSCLIPVREGMSVKRQSGAPSFRTEENK